MILNLKVNPPPLLKHNYPSTYNAESLRNISELGLDLSLLSHVQKLVVELMPRVMPLLKEKVNESSIDRSDEADEISAASARAPVAYAIVASYQLRWFVTQVDYPSLGKLCSLVIPCCLTALDHWSPEVKVVNGTFSFNVSWLNEMKLWHLMAKGCHMFFLCYLDSLFSLKYPWYEKLLNEMLSHLERQPRNKERRTAWLKHIDPLFNSAGLVLLAHFRRIFPLFFKWMHADDDETVLLVLDQITLVEAALKIEREAIRTRVLEILILLHQCKGPQFEGVWNKHKDDPNLTALASSLNGNNSTLVSET
ncbi:hypothetical protein POM88_048460 [Heracleum sosnowskyi]|uniref:Uncharacterized protein n=1 Tax=Heracleum sosnowskyi TaxID=360622 RepID=A0AAD8M0H4_9APIA|nr:hypothetical protein POM88_048460 [Heracleum sosnowskyi]